MGLFKSIYSSEILVQLARWQSTMEAREAAVPGAPHGHADVSHSIFGCWLLPASWLQEQLHAIRKTYAYFKCENNPIPTFVMLLVSRFG